MLFLLFTATMFSQISVGAQFVYGTDAEIGAGVKASFKITDAIKVSPSINYYFGESVAGVSSSSVGFNADGHYVFDIGNGLSFYPLAGLNVTLSRVSGNRFFRNNTVSNTEIGVNVGGGVNYNFTEKLTGVFETKYVVGNYDQAVFSAGVLFNL